MSAFFLPQQFVGSAFTRVKPGVKISGTLQLAKMKSLSPGVVIEYGHMLFSSGVTVGVGSTVGVSVGSVVGVGSCVGSVVGVSVGSTVGSVVGVGVCANTISADTRLKIASRTSICVFFIKTHLFFLFFQQLE
jgi:hypothetical protein